MYNWLKQIFWIFFFLGLGQFVSFFTGGLYPGCFFGMIFLFLALFFGIFNSKNIENISNLLLKHWSLFLLPSVAGIAYEADKIFLYILPILFTLFLVSSVVIACVGLIAQYLENKIKKR